jgi:hypothetical protein
MSQVLHAFGLLDFTILRPILALRGFSSIFNFLSGRGNPWILNQWVRRHTCGLYFAPNMFINITSNKIGSSDT